MDAPLSVSDVVVAVQKLLEAEATINDIAVWIAARRFDILKWVDPIIGPSSEVVAFDIWIDPKTHDDVNKCPWLRKCKRFKCVRVCHL